MSLKDKLPQPHLPEKTLLNVRANESYHLLKILSEFLEAGEDLRAIWPAVSIYGSARTSKDSPYYTLCQALAKKLSDSGFSVISGGGPGIMEAANMGAFAGKSPSVGLNIILPHEPEDSRYQDLSIKFHHFFPRKVMFVKHAIAFVAFPGGFGTLDELFESLTLVQTGKSKKRPIYLVGKSFWAGLINWVKDQLLSHGYINEADMDLIKMIDDPDQIVEAIFNHYEDYPNAMNKDNLDNEWILGL